MSRNLEMWTLTRGDTYSGEIIIHPSRVVPRANRAALPSRECPLICQLQPFPNFGPNFGRNFGWNLYAVAAFCSHASVGFQTERVVDRYGDIHSD